MVVNIKMEIPDNCAECPCTEETQWGTDTLAYCTCPYGPEEQVNDWTELKHPGCPLRDPVELMEKWLREQKVN